MMNNNKSTNNDKHLERLLKSATGNIDDSVDDRIEKESKMTPKRAIYTTLGVMGVFAVILVIGSIMLKPQEFEDVTKNPEWVDDQTVALVEKEENSKWDFEYPDEVPKWSKKEYSVDSVIKNKDTYNEIIEHADNIQDLNSSTSWMPSAIQSGSSPVYTNNTWESELSDGVANPRFSYTLQEDYKLAYVTYLERLINPTFGGWIFSQRATPAKPYKDDEAYEVLKDMFSAEWWDNNIKSGEDYTSLPILADWNGDNFGGLEFAERVPGRYGTFFGKVNEGEGKYVTVETLGPDSNGAEILNISTPIVYSAFGVDDEIINKFGTINMKLASNDNISQLNNRVVIIDIDLILN